MVEHNPEPENTSSPGVPTLYAGTWFRSRLEARWAAFADLAGWPWVHEPFDGAGYLPDFCFTVAGRPLLVEVKPIATLDEAKAHLPKVIVGIGGLWKHDVIICGIDPRRVLYIDFLNGPDDWHTSPGVFSLCPRCQGALNLHPGTVGYACVTCGDKRAPETASAYLDVLWRKAGNDTRWIPKDGAA